jgi:hypothetical protein
VPAASHGPPASPAAETAIPDLIIAPTTAAASEAVPTPDLAAVQALLDAAANPSVPVTQRGMTLGFLRRFIATVGPKVTVAQSVEAVVRPASAATKWVVLKLSAR